MRLFGSGEGSPHEAAAGAQFSQSIESDSCRLIYICWIPLQGNPPQGQGGAASGRIWVSPRRTCILPRTDLVLSPLFSPI